jgi:hypothetical protein
MFKMLYIFERKKSSKGSGHTPSEKSADGAAASATSSSRNVAVSCSPLSAAAAANVCAAEDDAEAVDEEDEDEEDEEVVELAVGIGDTRARASAVSCAAASKSARSPISAYTRRTAHAGPRTDNCGTVGDAIENENKDEEEEEEEDVLYGLPAAAAPRPGDAIEPVRPRLAQHERNVSSVVAAAEAEMAGREHKNGLN